MIRNHPQKNRGSALLLVLCAIALMSLTILGLVEFTDLGLSELADKEKDFRAMQLAESGLALGLHPDIQKGDPVLEQKINSTESFSVTFKSEGGKLNINAALLRNDESVLLNLLASWGVKLQDRQVIVDCLMDWVDGDPLTRPNGAEEKEYLAKGLKGYPSNRPFHSLDEMDLVMGMDKLSQVKPDWKDYFTVWTDGRLDLNEAPADVIAAVCKVGSLAAETFVKRRLGPDGKDGTEDDFHYSNFVEVRTALGISEKESAEIEKVVTLKSDYRRIESLGKVGSYERKLAVVVQLNINPVQYLTWIEF